MAAYDGFGRSVAPRKYEIVVVLVGVKEIYFAQSS